MLAKKLRLTKEEFDTVMRHGSPHRISFGKILILQHEKTKFAVSVPKKIVPKAHDRNTIRRSIYRKIHHFLKVGTITPGFYVFLVFIDTKKSSEYSQNAFNAEISALLN